MTTPQDSVRVWDPLVRIGHWSLVAAFLVAYFTAEELEDVHVAAGYWVGAYVVVRVVWGFVGPGHARFSDFVRGPGAVFSYLRDLLARRPAHYLGHNPAGGAMIVALLLGLAATTLTGLMVQADAEQEGPLAAWLGHPSEAVPVRQGLPEATSTAKGDAGEPDSVYAELHDFSANFTLALVALHVLGVLAGSLVHKENLVRAMITGRKPAPPPNGA
jgi:cytochrome b